MGSLLSRLFCTLSPLEEHLPACHCSHQCHTICQASVLPVPPPCLCARGQQELSPRTKDRLCDTRQVLGPCRKPTQGASGRVLPPQPPPYSIPLTPYPSHLLFLNLISSVSLSTPSARTLATTRPCFAGCELPSCSAWHGFGWFLEGALHP